MTNVHLFSVINFNAQIRSEWFKHNHAHLCMIVSDFRLTHINESHFSGQLTGLNKARDLITVTLESLPSSKLHVFVTIHTKKAFTIIVLGQVRMTSKSSAVLPQQNSYFVLTNNLNQNLAEEVQMVSFIKKENLILKIYRVGCMKCPLTFQTR